MGDGGHVVVVGGGLVGSLLSVFLVRRGLPVTVYDWRDDTRSGGREAGRSINLVVTGRENPAFRTFPTDRSDYFQPFSL